MSGSSAEFDTPNIRAVDAALIIHSKINIEAPASTVFRSLRNTETWRDWNRFIPKVSITYQPPEPDSATAAEIQMLVRNTSLIGSFYSDLTDGGVGGGRPRSPDEQPPPRYRLGSISSQVSAASQGRPSESADRNNSTVGPTTARGSVGSIESTDSRKSGAQKFQESQAARKASGASGADDDDGESDSLAVPNTATHRGSVVLANSPLGPASGSVSSPSGKRKNKKPQYTQSVSASSSIAMQKAQSALLTVYGEPSVRLQIKTKMTFYTRMKAASPSDYVEVNAVVTEISRPDDPVTEAGTTALTRSKTHNFDRAGHYRIVWTNDSEGGFSLKDAFRSSKPKAERVHEIIPTGENSCIYKTWECSVGSSAKSTKKKSGEHLQKMSELWVSGLKDFCEGLHAPKIQVRDFSITSEDVPQVVESVV